MIRENEKTGHFLLIFLSAIHAINQQIRRFFIFDYYHFAFSIQHKIKSQQDIYVQN